MPEASLAEQAAEAIARMISALEPGARLGTKEDLRARVGISPGTFNEALRLLRARGLISVRRGPGGGLFAAAQSPMAQLGEAMLSLDADVSSVTEAVRMRNALDPLLIEDAINHSSARDIRVMRQHLDAMGRAVEEDQGIAFLHANWRLHGSIAAVSPHSILRTFYTSLLNLIEQHTISISAVPQRSPLSAFHRKRHAVHVALVDAIAERDPERALALIDEHNDGIAIPTGGRPPRPPSDGT